MEEGVGRESSSRSSSFRASSGLEAGTVCHLLGCGKTCFQGKDFCGKSHALEQMQLAAAFLEHSRPVCRLKGCSRAAAVRARARCYEQGVHSWYHDFCSWGHCKEWHASPPLSPPVQTAAQEAEVVSQLFKVILRREENVLQAVLTKVLPCPASKLLATRLLSDCLLAASCQAQLQDNLSPGQAEMLNRLLDAVEISWPKDTGGKRMREELFASSGPVEFYTQHPWEMLKDHQGPLYFVSFRAATASRIDRGTKDHRVWRQSSRPAVSKDGKVQKQSFSYKSTKSKTGHDSDLVKMFRAEEKLDQGGEGTSKRKRDGKWRYLLVEYTFHRRPTLSTDSSESQMLPVLHALRQRDGFPEHPCALLGAAAAPTQEGQESSLEDSDFPLPAFLDNMLDSPDPGEPMNLDFDFEFTVPSSPGRFPCFT